MATLDRREMRWDLRVAESEDALVRAASSALHENLTSFVRNAAMAAARRILADRTAFELEQERWDEFMARLDRPAEVPAGLRRLFEKPSVFE
jgi:uncharacterized protein (DUF1778 family)